jgi:PKD repeat protein
VTAFFNASPAIPVVNQNVTFDGSGSFTNPSGGIASYSWNFGDNSMTGQGRVVSHNYTASAPYTVTLTVTDNSGGVGKISKSVFVSANLGGINVNIRQVGGNQVIGLVIASLYNGSVFVENRTKPALTAGSVFFLGLKPGPYRVSFSGPSVVVSSVTETVIPGWITYDTAFLTLVDQPRSDSLGFYILLLVTAGGGIALGSVAILRRRNVEKRRSASRDRANNR